MYNSNLQLNVGHCQNSPDAAIRLESELRHKFRTILPLTNKQLDRFWAKVIKTEDGCWEWQAALRTGYGAFAPAKIQYPAHRISYFLFHGQISDDLVLDHVCRNPKCVNPLHLEEVTDKENIMRGFSPPATNARKTHCAHGHEYSVENTRWYRGARLCRECDRTRQIKTYIPSSSSVNDEIHGADALANINRTKPLGSPCPNGHIYTEATSRLIRTRYGFRRFCRPCDAARAKLARSVS